MQAKPRKTRHIRLRKIDEKRHKDLDERSTQKRTQPIGTQFENALPSRIEISVAKGTKDDDRAAEKRNERDKKRGRRSCHLRVHPEGRVLLVPVPHEVAQDGTDSRWSRLSNQLAAQS